MHMNSKGHAKFVHCNISSSNKIYVSVSNVRLVRMLM